MRASLQAFCSALTYATSALSQTVHREMSSKLVLFTSGMSEIEGAAHSLFASIAAGWRSLLSHPSHTVRLLLAWIYGCCVGLASMSLPSLASFGYTAARHGKEAAFLEAVTEGQLEEVQRLLGEGVDVNCFDDEKSTPLHVAAFCGHESIVAILLSAGASLVSEGQLGSQPLHVAAYVGHATIVRRLLAAKADVDARDDEERTPLHLASARGRVAVCEALIAAGASTSALSEHGLTPLKVATREGHSSVVQMLEAASKLKPP